MELMLQNKKDKNMNYQIQSLRGIFCVFLVLYHYTCRYSQIYGVSEFYSSSFNIIGNAGLASFLIISGYYFNRSQKKCNLLQFIFRKINRLYPDYLIAITIIFIFSLTGLLGADREVGFIGYLMNIPMINVFFGVGYIDGSHWYVTFLLLMTICFSVLRLLKIDKNRYVWMLSSIVVLCLCVFLIIVYPSIINKVGDYIRYYILFSYGVIIQLLNYEKEKKDFGELIIFSITGIICLYMLKGLIYTITIIISTIIVVLAFAEKINPLEKLIPLAVIGEMSYIIYLLHQNMGYMIINFCRLELCINNILSVICALVFVIGLSYIITLIKQKLYRRIHKGVG